MRKWVRRTRRRLLKATGGAAWALANGAGYEAIFLEPRWVNHTRPVVWLEDLPPAWDGARIALLTDIHLGPVVELDYVAEAVEMANRAAPHIVVLTGDFVSRRRAIHRRYSRVLGGLCAGEGKFAVLGNHDHWIDPTGVSEVLSSAGITMLTNGRRTLERRGQQLCLAGVDDPWSGRPDLGSALGGVAEHVPRILLCHNPDYAELMPADQRVDLMLCGHTHGKQTRYRLFSSRGLPRRYGKYAAGLAEGPNCQVYISCGLGMNGLPIRWGSRPELPVITLRRAPQRAERTASRPVAPPT